MLLPRAFRIWKYIIFIKPTAVIIIYDGGFKIEFTLRNLTHTYSILSANLSECRVEKWSGLRESNPLHTLNPYE